jgi:hypothetical protein
MFMKILSTEALCICGKRLGEDTLVLIESGQMLPSKKDNRFLRFHPDWSLPADKWNEPGDPESVLRKVVHFECLRERFNITDKTWRGDPQVNECHICDRSFLSCKWAHRYTVGEIVNGIFEQDLEMPNWKGIVCSFCAEVIAQDPPAIPEIKQPTRGQLSLFE